MDDLYNNLKIYELEVKGTSSSSTNTQNITFVSANSSTNGAVNTAYGDTTASTQATAVNSTTIDNLSDAVICAFFAKRDLRWQMAMLTMRARRFLKNTGRNFSVNGTETIGFDNSKENTRRRMVATNFALMAYSSTSSNSELRTVKLRLVKQSLKHFRERINGAPIIEDWVSDNEEDDVPQAMIEKKTFKPSFAKIEFVKPKQQEKTARKTVNHVEQNRQNIHTPRGNQRN
ncbi:hypothetical protein Tco_1275047 [Tanacetum coccineum]